VNETGGPANGGVPTISELIEQRKTFLGLSYREMSEKADRAGLHVKHQTIQALATERPKQWPKETETIRGLAEALDVPEQLVVLSFAQSFGLDVRLDRSRLASLLPSQAAALPGSVQDAIAMMVRALVDSSEEIRHVPAPTTDAGGTPASTDPVGQFTSFITDPDRRAAVEAADAAEVAERARKGQPNG
jgi:hypothetical protein